MTVQAKFQIINEYKQGRSAVELAERHGTSLRSFFRWLKRFDGSIESLRDGRAANGRDRLKVTPEVEDRLVEFRAEKMGYKRIGWRLKRKHGIKLSPTAVKQLVEKTRFSWLQKKAKGKASTGSDQKTIQPVVAVGYQRFSHQRSRKSPRLRRNRRLYAHTVCVGVQTKKRYQRDRFSQTTPQRTRSTR